MSFSDVTSKHFAEKSILALAKRKVINGYTDGTFKPEELVTRAEAASMLVKALGIVPAASSSNFKDIKAGAWYSDSVSTAVQAGLFKGYNDGTFKPNQVISQEEMVSILYQALLYGGNERNTTGSLEQFNGAAGYSNWSKEAVNAVLQQGIMKQTDVFSIQAGRKTTRAESAELIYRVLSALKMI